MIILVAIFLLIVTSIAISFRLGRYIGRLETENEIELENKRRLERLAEKYKERKEG